MKIGMWGTNVDINGESTALFNWYRYLKDSGIDVTLFTTTKSGRRIQLIQTAHPFEVVKDLNAVDYVKQFDLIVFYGTGSSVESLGVVPIYLDAVMKAGVPYVMSVASLPSLINTPWNHSRLHYARGVYFLRETIRDFTNLRYPFIVDKPQLIVKHPVDVPDDVALNNGTKILYTSRASYVKHLTSLLEAEDVQRQWPLEIWSSLNNRYGAGIVSEYGDRVLKRTKGGYTHEELDKVYENGMWTIDLTYVKNEPQGGIQNVAIESLLHGVPVMTSQGWSPWTNKLEFDVKNKSSIQDAVNVALSSSDEIRDRVLQSGLTYLRQNHGLDQVTKFKSWLESLV